MLVTAADDFNFEHFWGLKMTGPLQALDLPALGTDFSVPIFILQGQEDLQAVPEIAKAYFDSIKAPRKKFYLVPGTGHEPSATSLDSKGLPITQITVKSNSVRRRLAALISGAEENNGTTVPAEEQRQPKVSSKGDRDI